MHTNELAFGAIGVRELRQFNLSATSGVLKPAGCHSLQEAGTAFLGIIPRAPGSESARSTSSAASPYWIR